MQDFSIHRCTKRCRISSRALAPGEWYYSVVERKNVNVVRYDIALSQWSGPPPRAMAWWKSQMPEAKQAAYTPTPNSQLLERLRELCDEPAQKTLAYLLAMLLVRRKVLEYANNNSSPNSEPASQESLVLKSISDGTEFHVSELSDTLTEEEVASYQQVLQDELVLQVGELAETAEASELDHSLKDNVS